jgi:Domain of unknown function (DUF4062)
MKDTDPIRVFISSKQAEFSAERQIMKKIIEGSDVMAPVVAEDFAPERGDVRSRYLADVERCPIYVGLFGCVYSAPTEDEYRHALLNPAREILLYVRPCPDRRDEALARLVAEFEARSVPKKLDTVQTLRKNFAEHLHRALSRMIRVLMDQQAPPRPQSVARRSSIREEWEERRQRLGAIGFPVDDANELEKVIAQFRTAERQIKSSA